MVDELSLRLVSDALWEIVEPLIPRFAARPQGGGSAPVDDRAIFTAIVFVLTSGCGWRHLPPSFGVTVPTAHRRFTAWAAAGVFENLHREVHDRLSDTGELDWSAAILDAASVRATRHPRS
ncbi:transposase [Rhodococcus sp. LB1]|nr:transposase [Rhodococcus sp. LB1]